MSPEDKALVERARFLASGQDDPHSSTITDLVARIEALSAERDALRERVGQLDRAGRYLEQKTLGLETRLTEAVKVMSDCREYLGGIDRLMESGGHLNTDVRQSLDAFLAEHGKAKMEEGQITP